MKPQQRHLKIIFVLAVAISVTLPLSLRAQSLTFPKPWGGKRELKEFIKGEMVYPEKALREKTEGTVEFSFVVNKDGSVSDLKIVRSVSPEIDNEALRIFKKILWEPATRIGEPVNYLFF